MTDDIPRISCFIVMLAVMISAIPVLADSGSRGTSPNYATVDVHLTYQNGSDADGMQVFLSPFEDFGLSALFSSPVGGGHYAFIVDSYNWGPMQLYAHDDNNTLWWFQKQYIEPKGRYQVEGVIAPHPPSSIRIYGVVRNGSSGSPIHNASIEAYYFDDSLYESSNSTISGTDGSYEVRVPDSKHAVYLYTDAEGYIGDSRTYYLTGGKSSYEVYINLYPLYPPLVGDTVPFKVRITNSTTGDHMMADWCELSGISSLFGHYRTSFSTWDPDPLTGYSTLNVEPGEYESSIRVNYPMDRINIESSGYLNIDEDPITLDVRIPVPELKRIDLLVRDEDGPIRNAQVYYAHEFREGTWPFSIHGSWETDADGEAYLMVPADIPINLNLYHMAHLEMSLPVDPRSDPNPLTINMEKDPGSEYPPHGNVSILVLDPITDVPIPSAWFNGYGQIPGEDRMAHFLGYSGPDGYLNCSVESATYHSIMVSCSLGTAEIVNLTVTEGSLTTRTVYLDRADYPPDPVEISFLIRDPEGIPLPDQYLYLTNEDLIDTVLSSDGMGMVRAYLEPGRYSMTTPDEFKYSANMGDVVQGIMPRKEIVIDPDGGMLPDVTMYLPRPLFSIDGMVRDALTGDPILEQGVEILSKHYLDAPPTRQLPYLKPYFSGDEEEDRPSVDLFQESGGSDHNGYYRLWGRESATISVVREGYYPYFEEMNITESVPDHDILLIPIPERNASVTGMLVDADGNPLNGSVAIVDPAMDDYEIDSQMINDTGEFSLLTYTGKVRAVFGNSSLWDHIDLDVPVGGIKDLKLVLSPRTFINGTVTDWEGNPVPGIEVMLYGPLPMGNITYVFYRPSAVTLTDDEGLFSFNATRGIYRIEIPSTKGTMPYNVSEIECDGWIPLELNISLSKLTEGYIHGRIVAIGGPMDGQGLAGSYAILFDMDTEMDILGAVTDGDGYFSFDELLPLGATYAIGAEPPRNRSGKKDIRSGYLWNFTSNFTLDSFDTDIVLGLPYLRVANMTWVNITECSPRGENIDLNEPISITFTHRMDFSEREIISDPPVNMTRGGKWDGTTVSFDHDNFEPNTTYTITIPGDFLSQEGYPLWNYTGITWTFKTGSTFWHIDHFTVDVIDGRSVQADAWGGSNQTVFIIINEASSFKLDEIEPGHYRLFIGEEWFSWDSYYTYYFSDSDDGKDDDPELRGSFKTYTGGKPPQYYEEEDYQNEPDLVGCLTCCGIGIVVVLLIVGVVLLLSKIKSRYDEKNEE